MATGKIKGIYQRGNIYWLTKGSGKRRLQVSLETTDYAEAVSKAQALLSQPLLNPSEGFVAELDRFADEQIAQNVWTQNSRKSKYSILLMFGEDQNWTPLPDITTGSIQKWYNTQVNRVKSVTANSYVTTVASFFNWAVGKKLIARNPATDVQLKKTVAGARKKFCTFADRDRIIAGAPTAELKFILYCGFFAGFRKNEIIEARPDWFDVQLRHIHVKKTETFLAKDKEERTIPMADAFEQFLKEYGSPHPFMIKPEVQHGKANYRYDFRKPYEEYMESIGFGWVTPHIMRHSFASLLAINGCSLYKIAQWLGDAIRTVEKHYAHLLPNDPDIEMLNQRGRQPNDR